MSRLEPENNAHLVIEAYRHAGGLEGLGMPLVVVGDAPYATDYKVRLEQSAAATPGVLLTGYIFGDGYVELQSNALAYVQATEVGGTHPVLVEAMGRGASSSPTTSPSIARSSATRACTTSGTTRPPCPPRSSRLPATRSCDRALGAAAARRAPSRYSWEHVTDQYEQMFHRLTGKA